MEPIWCFETILKAKMTNLPAMILMMILNWKLTGAKALYFSIGYAPCYLGIKVILIEMRLGRVQPCSKNLFT